MGLLLAALRAGGLRFKYQILSDCSAIHTRGAECKNLPFGLAFVHLRERATPARRVHPRSDLMTLAFLRMPLSVLRLLPEGCCRIARLGSERG